MKKNIYECVVVYHSTHNKPIYKIIWIQYITIHSTEYTMKKKYTLKKEYTLKKQYEIQCIITYFI